MFQILDKLGISLSNLCIVPLLTLRVTLYLHLLVVFHVLLSAAKRNGTLPPPKDLWDPVKAFGRKSGRKSVPTCKYSATQLDIPQNNM